MLNEYASYSWRYLQVKKVKQSCNSVLNISGGNLFTCSNILTSQANIEEFAIFNLKLHSKSVPNNRAHVYNQLSSDLVACPHQMFAGKKFALS